MKNFAIHLAALASSAMIATPASAQDSSYSYGTVWEFSSIKVVDGQFENYIDFLGKEWRKQLEFGKKEGYVVSYHVLALNNSRKDEPDLILAVQYKDYFPIAKRLEIQKKFEAMMAADSRKLETQYGERTVMRKSMGTMELQELKLK